MSQLDRLARPWRDVGIIEPAELVSNTQTRWVSVNTHQDHISIQWSSGKGFSLLLSCESCSYRRDSDDADAVKTIPTERLLGAKVVSKGVEDGHIRTAITLVLSPKASQKGDNDPPATPADREHIEVVLYECSARAQSLVRSFAARRHPNLGSSASDSPDPFVILPLSVQEYIAAQVNHFLEVQRGEFSVLVENDLFVNGEGEPGNIAARATPNTHQDLVFSTLQPTIPSTTTAASRSESPRDATATSSSGKPRAHPAAAPQPDSSTEKLTAQPAATTFTDTFLGTSPICRPWRFTSSRPLALSCAPTIHEDARSLTITMSPPQLHPTKSLIFRITAMVQVTIAALVLSQARTAYRMQAWNIFVAARCARQVIKSNTPEFPSQLATALLHAHAKAPTTGADSDADSPLLSQQEIAANRASLLHALTPFHRSPACGRYMVGSAFRYLAISFFAWSVVIMAAYVLIVWMHELVGVHGAWYGIRLTPEGCRVLRTSPVLSGRWVRVRTWLRKLVGAAPEQDIQGPVMKAKVAVTQVTGSTIQTHLELHTASQVHRLLDPLEDLPQAALESTVAAINRYLCKHSPHITQHPDHTTEATIAAPSVQHGDDKAPQVAEGAHGALLDLHGRGSTCSLNRGEGDAGADIHLQRPAIKNPPDVVSSHAYDPSAAHAHAARPCMRAAEDPDTFASVYTPLRPAEAQADRRHARHVDASFDVQQADSADACGLLEAASMGPGAEGGPEMTALGQPMAELRRQQTAAIRATNYQREDGRWVSTAVPPVASAHIQVLSRGPGELWLRVSRPSRRWTAVRTLSLLPISPLLATFAAVFGSSVLPPLVALRASPVCGAAAAALALVPLFLRGAETADVRVSRAGLRLVRKPWWGLVPCAIALSQWVPVYATARARTAQLAGAEVTAQQGSNGALNTSVRLHIRSETSTNTGTAAASGDPPANRSANSASKAVSILPLDDLWEAQATPLFSVADKLFVAGHINACLAELRWQELPALSAVDSNSAVSDSGAAVGDPEQERLLHSCDV